MRETDADEHRTAEGARSRIASMLRDLVFGAEDGLLSTLGLVTGVAGGTKSSAFVLLAGVVGALSGAFAMGAGNYLGAKSQSEVLQRRMEEEKKSILENPIHESAELVTYYEARGLTPEEIGVVVPAIMRKADFILEEMGAHELHIDPEDLKNPIGKGLWMFVSYLIAAALPILPYALLGRKTALIVSVFMTALAVFGIGAAKTVLTKRNPIKSGLEMLVVAASAGIIGYIAGHFATVSGI